MNKLNFSSFSFFISLFFSRFHNYSLLFLLVICFGLTLGGLTGSGIFMLLFFTSTFLELGEV